MAHRYSQLKRFSTSFALACFIVFSGLLLLTRSVSAAPLCNDYQTRGNGDPCASGQVCISDGETEFGLCQAYDLKTDGKSSTGNSIAFNVSSIASRIQTINVSGCLGTLPVCGTPATRPAFWVNFPAGTSVSAITNGLRPGRTYQYSFYSTFETTNATHTDSVTTLPGPQFTPTVSNISDVTATVSWTTPSDATTRLYYRVTPPNWILEGAPAPIVQLNDIATLPNGRAWAVGYLGKIFTRDPITETWTAQTSPTGQTLISVSIASDQVIWTAGTSGTILRTTNGGGIWSAVASGVTDQINAIFATTTSTAWAVTNNGKILNYNGTAWTTKYSDSLSRPLYQIVSVNDKEVWAVGNQRLMVKSTDSGATWQTSTLSLLTGAGNTVATLDGTTVYVGGAGGEVIRSDNAGTTWSAITVNSGSAIVDFELLSNSEFWFSNYYAVGHYVASANPSVNYDSSVPGIVNGGVIAIGVIHGAKIIAAGNDSRIAITSLQNSSNIAGSATLTKTHSVPLNTLAGNTTYYFAAESKDATNNVSYGSFGTFTTTSPDNIPPTITVTQPNPSPVYVNFANRNYQIRGTISDERRLQSLACTDNVNRVTAPAPVVTPLLPLSNPAGVNASWTYQAVVGPSEAVTYTYDCAVSDGTNTAIAQASIIYDATTPSAAFVLPNPINGDPLVGPNFPITINATDANGFGTIEYVLNSRPRVSVPPPGGTGGDVTFNLDPAGVNNGNNDLTVFVTDKAGNVTTISGTFPYTAPGYQLTLSPANITTPAGTSAVYTATITPVGGFTGNVTLALSGQPAGSNVTISQNPVTLGAGAENVTVTIATPGTATATTYNLSLSSTTAPIPTPATATLTLTAAPDFSVTTTTPSRTVLAGNNSTYTLSVNPNTTYTGTVATMWIDFVAPATALPAGVSASFSPGTFSMTPSTNVPVTMTVTTSAATPAGTHILRVNARDTASRTRFVDVTLVVNQPPDVNLSVLPNSLSITAGSGVAANYNGKAIAVNGYNRLSTVTASVGSVVPGLTISITPNVFVPAVGPNGTDFTLSVLADSRVPGTTHTLTVTLRADDGSLTKNVSVTLIITGDTTPPIISITQPDVTPNWDRVTIASRTNKLAMVQVEVFTDAARTISRGILGDPTFTTTRSMVYPGLAAATTYYVTVTATDQAATANRASTTRYDDGTDLVFTTLDEPDFTPPTIRIDQPSNGATVVGNVTITGQASDNKMLSTVVVSITRPDGTSAYSQTQNVSAPVYNFVVNWNSLTDRINGLYTVKARATDTAGNPSPEASININVQNDLTPPVIQANYPQVINILCDDVTNKCQATVVWFTDDPSTTRVNYATELEYFGIPPGYKVALDRDDADPSTSPSAPVHTEHRLTITGLDRNELYHYQITSCNISGDCTS